MKSSTVSGGSNMRANFLRSLDSRFIAAALTLALLCPWMMAEAQLVVRGDVVYTSAGPPIDNGVVVISNGRIVSVGVAGEVAVPYGYREMEAAYVTPGLVDAHGTVGMSGIFNQPHDQDQLEKSDPLQPELRAIDGFNAREDLVAWVRDLGTTTVHTGHGPGATVSGQTLISKTNGETAHSALLDSSFALAITLGSSVSSNFKSPGTRSKGVALFRNALVEAQNYTRKRNSQDDTKETSVRSLRYEALASLLSGDLVALVTAHRASDILTALRLADEFGFRLILDGASEVYLVLDEVAEAGVPVILHPQMARAGGELRNLSLDTVAQLRDHAIPFAIQSGFEGYVPKTRVVLFEAAIAAANGLTFEEALASITISPARILGIDDRVGSIEPGKDADLVLFDGDPFEYTSHVCGVIIDGVPVSETCR